MKLLQPYPIAIALSFVFFILYLVCVGLHLVVPDTVRAAWPMHRLWALTLPGFSWISTLTFFLGSLEIFLGGFYVGFTLIPLYNRFNRWFPIPEGEEDMKSLRFKPVALALSTFGVITYTLCIVFDLIFPQWAMAELWEILLPGFTWISWGSFFIGLLGVVGYGVYAAALLVPIYNYFSRGQLPRVN